MYSRRSPWLIAGLVLMVAMISMACLASVNVPQVQSPGQQPTQAVQLPVNPTLENRGSATQEPQNGTGTTGGQTIPQTGNQTGNVAPPVTDTPKNLEDIYDRSNPGVVSILVQVSQGGQAGAGAGSGFILTDAGYIVTNHHVIDGASQIIVRFYNNSDIQAKVVGDDPNADLAIIQVDKMAEGAHPLPMGDSSKLRVGDQVVAIGNPLALGVSMSSGIVSAVGRTIPSGFTPYNIPQAIQTDAAINPGNSGGPLINMNGEVVGINAQIRTTGNSEGNIGIGFAIPINILKQIYPSLLQTGSYAWPYLGVSSPAQNPLSLTTQNTEGQMGALIAQVESGGPADKAGLREGDVVTQADSQKITSFDDLLGYLAYKHPGDKVQLTVVRGSQTGQVTVTLGERPKNQQVPQQ